MAPRYGCLSATHLGKKVHFFNRGRYGIWCCANTTLRYDPPPPPERIEAPLLPFDLYYAVLCGPSYSHRTGAVEWRVLEHVVSTRNRLRFLPIMGLPPSGTARSPGFTYLQTFFLKVLCTV